jgi:hypothetical protein
VSRRGGVVPAFLFVLAGCGGGAPLLHPAHVLPPGAVRAGAGLSGQIVLRPPPAANGVPTPAKLQQITAAPGVAPWVGARIGIRGDNEGGLTYTGRSVRLDGRHAFSLGTPTLSVGLGASALAAQRPGGGGDGSSVFGGGFDVPILFGAKSASDLYSIWVGPRAGMEFLSGRVAINSMSPLSSVTARHIFAGVLAGIKVGFRHVHAAIELDFAYHRADGTFADGKVGLSQLTLTPGGALLLSF